MRTTIAGINIKTKENHLLTALKTGVSVVNKFDPLHRVREHDVGGTKNRFIYSGWRRIADYIDTALQNRYVYGIGLDEVLIQVSTSRSGQSQ